MEFVITVFLYSGTILLSNSIGNLLAFIPAFIFFTAYCVILFQWAVMVFTLRAVKKGKGDPQHIRKIFSIIFICKI